MSLLRQIPLWGYFIVLGIAFVSGHVLAYRPDPAMGRGRRLAGRWGSSLLLLVGLLLVSNRVLGTVLPAVLLALLGGVVSGRTAPPPRRPSRDRTEGAGDAADSPGAVEQEAGARSMDGERRQAPGEEEPPAGRR